MVLSNYGKPLGQDICYLTLHWHLILFSLRKIIRKATIILMAILRPAPVQLSDNSAESKQANNFEGAEQRPDTLQDYNYDHDQHDHV